MTGLGSIFCSPGSGSFKKFFAINSVFSKLYLLLTTGSQSQDGDSVVYPLGPRLQRIHLEIMSISLYLSDSNWSNEWDVITDHSLNAIESVGDKGKSASLVQEE